MDDPSRFIQEYADSLIATVVGAFLFGFGVWLARDRVMAVLSFRELSSRFPRLSRALFVGRLASAERASRAFVWMIAAGSLLLGVVALIVALAEI